MAEWMKGVGGRQRSSTRAPPERIEKSHVTLSTASLPWGGREAFEPCMIGWGGRLWWPKLSLNCDRRSTSHFKILSSFQKVNSIQPIMSDEEIGVYDC
jgi:hypothetical protein